LAVLLSRPAARRLPERLAWQGEAQGEQIGGIRLFLLALRKNGFTVQDVYGLHSGQSVLLNASAHLLRRFGGWAVADRLEFAARSCYILPHSKAWQATLALVMAVRR
jgi:hypothetical protein